MSCREHDPCEIEALPILTDVEGKPAIIVAVWSVDTAMGGPEEGGWWYETGDLIHFEVHYVMQVAKHRVDDLRKKYPYTGKRSSFSRDKEDYNVELRDDGKVPHPYFPLVRPHYE